MSDPLPDQIEIKFAFAIDSDTDRALQAIKGSGKQDPPEERTIYFFDTAGVSLTRGGLITRVRITVSGGDPNDSTLKIRGGNAPAIALKFPPGPDDGSNEEVTKYEGDQNASAPKAGDNQAPATTDSPAFSVTKKLPDKGLIDEALKNPAKLSALFGPTAESLFTSNGVVLGDLKAFGPIHATIWKFKPPGFDKKLTAELWEAGDKTLLEISDKKPRAQAAQFSAELFEFMSEKIQVTPLNTSKTLFAMQQFRPST